VNLTARRTAASAQLRSLCRAQWSRHSPDHEPDRETTGRRKPKWYENLPPARASEFEPRSSQNKRAEDMLGSRVGIRCATYVAIGSRSAGGHAVAIRRRVRLLLAAPRANRAHRSGSNSACNERATKPGHFAERTIERGASCNAPLGFRSDVYLRELTGLQRRALTGEARRPGAQCESAARRRIGAGTLEQGRVQRAS
jgi:hypothetical protein